MNYLRLLLLPFSLIYGIAVWLRNRLYDNGILKSRSFDMPIISVGNLEVGGSGKTPLTEYLVKILSAYRISTLSRGYGRKTKGFRWVAADDDSSLSGDEPLQIKKKFPAIGVAVCEDRVEGIERIKQDYEVIVLDDAYQHRAVKPGLSILVFNYQHLSQPRFLLPAGNYRDWYSERKRAHILLVSKCPGGLTAEGKNKIYKKMKPLAHQQLLFTTIRYKKALSHVISKEEIEINSIHAETRVLLITGIANPQPLIEQVREYTKHIVHHFYPDHHLFTTKNMLKLVSQFTALPGEEKMIITTEKDAVRLNTKDNQKHIRLLPVYQWPIEIAFLDDQEAVFNKEIHNYVISN